MKSIRKRAVDSILAVFLIVCIFMSSGLATIGSYIVNGIIVNAEGIKVVKIHYYREDGQYSDWDVWTWADGMDGASYALIDNGDSRGAVATIMMPASCKKLGFIIRKPDWSGKDTEEDRYVNTDSINNNFDVYCKSGVSNFTINQSNEPYSDIIAAGSYGDYITYTLDRRGTLIISGSGNMKDYYYKGSPFSNLLIKKIIIKDGVTSIGQCAFDGCTGLTSIEIPDSVTLIDNFAFDDCTGLTSIEIPDSVTSIGNYAFYGCTGLTSITIPDSVTSIGYFAFYLCKSLTSITISDSVTSIGDLAFCGCKSLTGIKIPDSVTSIGRSTFHGCEGLTSVTIPDSVTLIGDYAFYVCKNLTDVYYSGTEEEWKNINIDLHNECLTNANIHFNSMGDEEDGVTISFRSDTSEDMKLSHNFYYSDNLFEQKSTVFNQKLAILTLGMVMSGFSSGESDKYWSVGRDTTNDETAIKTAEKSRVENISHTYNLLGFDKSSIEYYNYDVSLNDASDKVAFSIASKKIHVNGANKTLVAVILRGGGYGSEWSSNFNMGSNGLYHEAFNNAAWEVADKVIDYLGRKKLTQNVKILMGGFSRAAATANLATAKLDKLSNSNKLYSISRDDIYTYTFATPQGVVDNNQNDIHNSLYNNIFNIVNPSDLVPTVALSKWGFGRYGVSLTLPYVYTSINSQISGIGSPTAVKVSKTYCSITQKEYSLCSAFSANKSDISEIDNLLYKLAKNTDVFVQNGYQNVITRILELIYSDYGEGNIFSNTSGENVKKILEGIYGDKYEDFLVCVYEATATSVGKVRELLKDVLPSDYSFLALLITGVIEYETGDVDSFVGGVGGKLLKELFTKLFVYVFYTYSTNSIPSALLKTVEDGYEKFQSLKNIFNNHYPELYLSWLESYEAKELFGKKTYKKITASCPVNVDVYSDNGELLASIVNNEIIKDDIPIYLENDSKEIWLMDGDKYDIKITAYDKGTMTYSVEEYNQDFEMQNKTNFYDVPLKKNSVFETAVSSSAGESVTLYDKDSKKTIYPSETLTKDDEEIEISVSCNSNGHVYGNQNVVKGEYVSVTAVPNDGYTFEGWFKDNKLISKELEYYFNAIENIRLVAKFEKIKSVLGDTNGDGKATIADSLMIARYEVKLRTLTDEQLAVSDVNYDGKVTISDALKIARYEVKLIDSL